MLRSWTALVLGTALASCGAQSSRNAEESPMNDSTTVAQFAISSEDLMDGQPIPSAFTCDGAGTSPQLSWPEPPRGTKSFALIVDDPDAPSGTFHHWGAYDIPATARSIPRGQPVGVQAHNDAGKSGYMGPCPPKGHGVHHYHFKLYALGVDSLKLPPDAKIPDVEAKAKQHQVAMTEIVGTYRRD